MGLRFTLWGPNIIDITEFLHPGPGSHFSLLRAVAPAASADRSQNTLDIGFRKVVADI